MTRGINFGAGPAALPEEVLREAQEALWEWNGQKMSVAEVGHRTDVFKALMYETEQDIADLLKVPENYRVLLLGGSARVQFAMIPMNLLGSRQSADYLLTGNWSEVAFREAHKYTEPRIAASSQAQKYMSIPDPETWEINEKAAYFYYTSNETLLGVQFHDTPKLSKPIPLVSDMTSDILSRPIDISQFGLIFAGSQKNIAPAGLTLVIVREDLIDNAMMATPTVFHYKTQAEQHSLYNTPPTLLIFMASRMLKWLRKQGGVEAMAEKNQAKAELLYDFIDKSSFYHNTVAVHCRSQMNVSFSIANPDLNPLFLEKAREAGLLALKGHALAGGFRASLYNAITLDNVKALIAFMAEFEKSRA